MNSFGKTSELNITTSFKDNKTYLEDVYFTAPFKIAKPFDYLENGINILIMVASAGIMSGDRQQINIKIKENSVVAVTSQSYEKIHKMEIGKAIRFCNIEVEEDSLLVYSPLPTIPFAGSAFENNLCVYLKSDTSKFFFSEIISCGRSARDEKFEYKFYKSNISIYSNGNLIVRDNMNFCPSENDLSGFGYFESKTHMANIMIFNFDITDSILKKIREIIDINGLDGGASFLWDKSISIRILGFNSQLLCKVSDEIFELVYLHLKSAK